MKRCKKCGREILEADYRWDFCPDCRKEKALKMKKALTIVSVAALAFSIVYGISPIDIIPDLTPIAGIVDDAAVGTLGIGTAIASIIGVIINGKIAKQA